MTEQIKFSDKEMKEFKDIQQIYVGIQYNFGQIAVSRIRVDKQVEGLDKYEDEMKKKLMDTQDVERKFLEKITEQYGEGSLDPKTGIYTKNQE
tara:strand:- start:187 stop:465 length:279 start_codon:yes stop_codon:yes gene_type:complete